MEMTFRRALTAKEKDRLILTLTKELILLRTKAEISQEELAKAIGISRQTYGACERGAKKMSWSTFLSLVLFFDANQKTRRMLRSTGEIYQEMIWIFNEGIARADG